jgi:hypothetical protein
MATEKQIQANRANAKRSTGPITEEGKKASSQNALRHGQLSSCVVLKSECAPLFDDLMDSLIAEFQPATPNESALIETMAVARWKLSRNWIMHTALLELETTKVDPSTGSAPVITAVAFKNLADSSHSLHLLHRYEVSLDRQYSRALNNLLKSRAARNQNPPPPEVPIEAALNPEPEDELPKEPNLSPQSPRKSVAIPLRQPVITPSRPKPPRSTAPSSASNTAPKAR